MPYGDFTLKMVVQAFGLDFTRDHDLFANTAPIDPSDRIRQWLDEFVPVTLDVNTEKARSEFIIAPILVEAKRHANPSVNILSGIAFDVDRDLGLTGFCDYLISRSDGILLLTGPLVAVVEAKKEDLTAGLGQCAAEMVAIRLFNDREKVPARDVFGCVTSGTNWRFLKLSGQKLQLDRPEYYVDNLAKVLGILVAISNG